MMPIGNAVDTCSRQYLENRDAMLALLGSVRSLEQRVAAISAAKESEFRKRGQLLPRQRVELLLDPGSPFLECSTLAGLGLHDDNGQDNVFGAGIILGIGFVSGTRCVIFANDSAIKGGTNMPLGLKKKLRGIEFARANRLPIIYLVESGGANLLYQAHSFVEAGESYREQARLSAAGIPQIAVVHGPSTAGGAYLPALCDYLVMVRGKGRVYLAGPPLLRAATGEIADAEALGGADMHATVSGVADYVADNDADAIRLARRLVADLRWESDTSPPQTPIRPPRFDPEELLGIVSPDFRRPVDVRQVISRVVDDSGFEEFKRDYGTATVCGRAAVLGQACALIGNNGPIDPDGAAKATQFIQLMCQTGTPIVYLQNITGFLVGPEAERRGVVKQGARMIQAVANATVPQITLHVGASFGAGNYGMCGRGFDPRFVFAWPNNRVAVMGGEQAARVMSIIATERSERTGKPVDGDQQTRKEQEIVAQFEHESTALYATARLWDDGIIDPRDTRTVLGFCLATCKCSAGRSVAGSTFGVPRG